MEQQQIDAHKTLAAAVICSAISDFRLKNYRHEAKEFLFSDRHKAIRIFWLSWLGLNDDGFQKLLRQKFHQGQANRLITWRALVP